MDSLSRQKTFETVWNLHYQWSKNILTREAVTLDVAIIYCSEIPGEFYNYAVPQTDNPSDLNLKEIEQFFLSKNEKPSFYLLEKHQHEGFSEELIHHGWDFNCRDTWMISDAKSQKDVKSQKADITTITPETFSDYRKVLDPVFSDFSGNEKYLEICLKTLKSEIKSPVSDLKSEFFLIYDSGQPAAGAALFYSPKENIAYLHDAGTLPKYRGKGYQTALINHRVQRALECGVDRIYSLVEHGGRSWKNCIKCGFNQYQVANLFVKNLTNI